VGARSADHATPFYPKESALASPATSVVIVRLRIDSYGGCVYAAINHDQYFIVSVEWGSILLQNRLGFHLSLQQGEIL
jgi:hypothetical protein